MGRDARARRRRRERTGARQEFYDCIRDLLEHPAVQSMKRYPHHGETSCFRHCLNVAYYNYEICKVLGLDARAAARAGLLHDLFLYDWHTHARKTGQHFHGLTHPGIALRNARRYFDLSDLEQDMIRKHMWPLTVIPPRYPESYVICLADKYCGALEVAARYSKHLPRLPFGYRTMYRMAAKLIPSGRK